MADAFADSSFISCQNYIPGEAPHSDTPYIPFVPYPTRDGRPIKTKLRPMQHGSDLRYGAPMSDPETSLHVPILAVTLHPETQAVLPVGGTHIDIVTGLQTPIEIGSLMVDPNSGSPVPVLSVTLDPESGNCIVSLITFNLVKF
jgi:hypothetical protein